MGKAMDFLADNYTIFAIISGVLLLALIGLLASSKKKKVVKTEDEAQPIKMDDMAAPIEPEIAPPPIPQSTLVVNNETNAVEPTIEPTLDSFASTATEVKVVGSDIANENNNMLIIEDKAPSVGVATNETIVNNNASNENNNMLIIEDKTPATDTVNNTIANVNNATIPDMNAATTEENFLVLDDKSPSVGVEIK